LKLKVYLVGMMVSSTSSDKWLGRNWQSCWWNPSLELNPPTTQKILTFHNISGSIWSFLFEARSLFSRKWWWVQHVWIKGWRGIDRVVDETPRWQKRSWQHQNYALFTVSLDGYSCFSLFWSLKSIKGEMMVSLTCLDEHKRNA
jgi:hypothetical protein